MTIFNCSSYMFFVIPSFYDELDWGDATKIISFIQLTGRYLNSRDFFYMWPQSSILQHQIKQTGKRFSNEDCNQKSQFSEWSIDCYKPYTYCSIFLMWFLPLLSPPPQFRFPYMLIYISTCIKHTNKEPNMIYITLGMIYYTAMLN